MYQSPIQEILANQVVENLDNKTLSKLWNNRDRSNQFFLHKLDVPINHDGVIIQQEHVKNELIKNRGFKFLSLYSTTNQEQEAVKALSEASTDLLIELWDNWDGCELIEINNIIIDQSHLHYELTENRCIKCFL